MSLWLIIPALIYIIGTIIFLIAVYFEAPKHGASVGPQHYLVAFLWPAWGVWYLGDEVADYFTKRN